MGRMKTFSPAPESNKEYDVFEKIGLDWKGPLPVSSRGNNGFILLKDQESKFLGVYPCVSRGEIVEKLEDFRVDVVNKSFEDDAKIKILQTDVDSAFIKEDVKEWMREFNVKFHLSAPYSHSQNGLVENGVGFLMDRMRSVMAEYGAPQKYWDDAAEHTAYTINMTHVPVSNMMTPYQMVYNTLPDVSNLVHFYSPGVYHLTKDERKGKSLAFKAEPCRMLGYAPESKNSYIVLNTRTGKRFTRKDCIFDESYYRRLSTAQVIGSNLSKTKELFKEFYKEDDEIFEEDKDLIEARQEIEEDYEQMEVNGNEDDFYYDDERPTEAFEEELLEFAEPNIADRVRSRNVSKRTTTAISMAMEIPLPVMETNELRRYLACKYDAKPNSYWTEENSICQFEQFLYDDGDEDSDYFLQETGIAIYFLQEAGNGITANEILNVSGKTGELSSPSASAMETVKVELPYCPQTTEDALACPEAELWIEAILKELNMLDNREVIEVAKSQIGRGMKTKMCFRVNYDNNFVVKRKARLVCCGYSQQKHLDYELTYSPTASTMSWMVIMQMAVSMGMFIIGFDITGAFLLADNDFENYAYLPPSLAPEGKR
jgi:hypothetical protein